MLLSSPAFAVRNRIEPSPCTESTPTRCSKGAPAQAVPPDAPERRYAVREVKARLAQASFRDAALNGLPGSAESSYGVRQNSVYGIGVMVPNKPSVSSLGP